MIDVGRWSLPEQKQANDLRVIVTRSDGCSDAVLRSILQADNSIVHL